MFKYLCISTIIYFWYGLVIPIHYHYDDHTKSLITPLKTIQTVLGSNRLLYKNYIGLKAWLRNGLLTNVGTDWHKKRKLLTSAFHFKILGSFKEPMEHKCNILISRLNKVADGRDVDIYPFITLFALDVISGNLMRRGNAICTFRNRFFCSLRNCNGSKSARSGGQ